MARRNQRRRNRDYQANQAVVQSNPQKGKRRGGEPENYSGNPDYSSNNPNFRDLLGKLSGNPDELFVNENVALNFSGIYSAVTLIAGCLATMPIQVYRRDKDNPRNRIEVFDHPACRILGVTPDGETPSNIWRETSQAHTLLCGNSFAEIVRNQRGQALELHNLEPHRVDCGRDIDTGKKYYQVSSRHGVDKLRNDQVLHIPALSWNGVTGLSPVKLARDTIALGLATNRYGLKYFEKGGRPLGFLTKQGTIPEPQRKQYREEWKELHEGIANWFSVGILSGGLEWKDIGVSPNEAQFLATRQFQIEEIARWYHIPPHMLAQMEKASPGNIEHLMIEFATFCLLPWVKRWEGELNMKLFTRVEQLSYYVKFNMSSILRADSKVQAEVLERQLRNGVITVNDWRELIDRNAYDDVGDKPLTMASQLATLADVEKGINTNSPLKQKKLSPKAENRKRKILDKVFAQNLEAA